MRAADMISGRETARQRPFYVEEFLQSYPALIAIEGG